MRAAPRVSRGEAAPCDIDSRIGGEMIAEHVRLVLGRPARAMRGTASAMPPTWPANQSQLKPTKIVAGGAETRILTAIHACVLRNEPNARRPLVNSLSRDAAMPFAAMSYTVLARRYRS